MPDAGEGLTEADIIGWRVAVGDTVTVNQVIVEIETAKAAVELPCPYAGRVHQLLAEPGATVEVGTPIITIDTGTDTGTAPAGDHGAVVEGGPVNGAAAETGSKIGEVTADGRIATLVGYVPAGRSGRPPPHHAPRPPLCHRRRRSRPSRNRRPRTRPTRLRWPLRRSASWPRIWVSTCTRWPPPARTG
jgi:pyruvate dehydrogenase E2 component (dihydrolipoamide acetyltransferase)